LRPSGREDPRRTHQQARRTEGSCLSDGEPMTTLTAQSSPSPRERAVVQTAGEAFRSPLVLAASAVGIIGFLGFFWPWFYRQHQFSWSRPEDWGHAYVIPLIAGYLLWRQRARLAACPIQPFAAGLPTLILGAVGFLYFMLSIPNHMLQGASMILALYGLTLTAFGPAIARISFTPIAFLVFGVTISEAIMLAMTFPLQLLASKGAWVMLGLILTPFGYTVEVDGNMLELFDKAGNLIAPLNVAQACSGMRMLIAFFALAGAVSLLSLSQWWQRILLIMLAIPVALLMNIVRVAVLGILTLVNPDLAAGDAHTLIGTILLVPSLGLFMAVTWALKRVVSDPNSPDTKPESKSSKTKTTKATSTGSRKGTST